MEKTRHVRPCIDLKVYICVKLAVKGKNKNYFENNLYVFEDQI